MSLSWLAVKSKGGEKEEGSRGRARHLTSSTCTLGSWTVCLDRSREKGHFGRELHQDCPRTHKKDRQKVYCTKDKSCKGCSLCVCSRVTVNVCSRVTVNVCKFFLLLFTNNAAANAIKLSAIIIITVVGEQWYAVSNIIVRNNSVN